MLPLTPVDVGDGDYPPGGRGAGFLCVTPEKSQWVPHAEESTAGLMFCGYCLEILSEF